jgi:hypothetical protein
METTSRFDLTNARWLSPANIARDFVRYPDPHPSPGVIWTIAPPAGAKPLITVVIPTSDGDRHGLFQKLLFQLGNQSMQEFEVISVMGDTRQGRAINTAAAMARGTYVITLDDDIDMMSAVDAFARLVDVMVQFPDIGMAAGNAVIPPDASPFVKRAMREIPRRAWEPVTTITESDLVQHGLLIMRLTDFLDIGGENELIPRGLDPYLRREMRSRGRRIVLVPGVLYAHLPPDNLGVLVRQFFRNGNQAALVNRLFPQWVIETPSHHGTFREQVPLPLRVLRLPMRLVLIALRGHFIRFVCEFAYMLGFAKYWLSGKR